MPFKIDTQTKGLFIVSEESITNYFFQKEESSAGLLVKSHYKEIEASLYLSWLIREGKTVESISAYFHTDEDLKDAPPLEKVVGALEHQLDLLTDGEYSVVVEILKNHNGSDLDQHKYWGEIQDIWWEIKHFQEGNYYEHPVRGRRGLPRITTIGERLLDMVMDFIWKMDNDAPNMWHVEPEMLAKLKQLDESVIPKFNLEDWK